MKNDKSVRRYHHIGIPTQTPREGEVYLRKYKVYATDHEANPYGIQWMRYDRDCPLPEIVKTIPHVAFEVEDLLLEIKNKSVIIEPDSPSVGVRVAFIIESGAPVELLEFKK
jgi:hypothetical protein